MAGKRAKGLIWDYQANEVQPLVWFGEPQSRLVCLAVSCTAEGAPNMAARWAMCYPWFGLVNPTPGWRACLSPPTEVVHQTWRPGGRRPPS
jgi:hypothetical protein